VRKKTFTFAGLRAQAATVGSP